MLQPSSVMPLLLALVVGGTAVAQPDLTPGAPGVRRLELAEEGAGPAHEVAISPGLTTAFRFHGGNVDREGVTPRGDERVWVSIAEESILIVPSEQAVSGQRLRLTVPFKGGEGPASATFILVVQPAQAERQVEVYRQPRRTEALRAELKEKDTRLQECQEQLDRLRSERTPPGGLSGLIATGQLDKTGVIATAIPASNASGPGDAVRVRTARSFRSVTRVAVEVWLEVSEEAGSWKAEGATLRDRAGEELTDVTVWQDATVATGTERRVVVEAEAPDDVARTPYILKLWGEGGRHSVTLGNVTFP